MRDAEERAILMALVMKGDFDGCNCFRSYGTLAKVARVDAKTAGRRCREMEKRGILRRQTQYHSRSWLAIPEKQRPVVWEVMIPAEWWSALQLEEINEQRASLGRHPLTSENRPMLAEAPAKKTRADKGTKRTKMADQSGEDPGTDSPWGVADADAEEGADPGTRSPHPGDYESVPPGLEVPQPSESPSEELAPAARSAGDARRASTGSSARGGCAATQKPARSRKKTRLTREEAAAVAVVEQAVPPSLLELLAGQKVPNTWRVSMLRELEHRTPEQLADRVARRWVAHRYQSHLLAGRGIDNPYKVLQALVRAGECPDAGCEDESMVDTGEPCRTCAVRKARRGASGGPGVPAQRSAAPTWECRVCRNPRLKRREPEPEDRECQDCKREAALVCEVLAARWNTPTTEDVNDR
ncbi:hypothetical protein [Streptomyces sp. Root369]|uniref:hypothetical protein n=1 Tax=Streptomyces sp. Root369 TaxID=1736523 RepID=UPI001301567B|nr:hypothetical protein [Streptomyces sp. Root369]